MLRHTVLLFGPLRDRFKASSITVELAAGAVLGQLLSELDIDAEHTKAAVDGNIVDVDTVLNQPAEIALLPPVSGG
jgi:molybdopterin converting factor small subunit